MDTKNPENYQVEDFVADESFTNYHFCLDTTDQLFWKKWVLAHPEKEAMVIAAKNMLNMLSVNLPDDEYKEELEDIKDAINVEGSTVKRDKSPIFQLFNSDKPRKDRSIKVRRATAIGLPLLLVLIIGGYFFSQRSLVKTNALTIKQNGDNKSLVFTLDDGTVVTLALNIVLKYPAQFKDNERRVYLHGEARFQVTKDAGHPFKVYQDNIIATVLGTDFNVKKQAGDSVISVELFTGKLQVEAISSGSSPQLIVLEPNQRAVYVMHKQALFKEIWKQSNEEDSLNNHLVFEQSSFEESAKRIKALYGVTVLNQSSKKNWRFTGEFYTTTAKEVIENICLVKKLNLEVVGDTFLIKNAEAVK